MTGSEVSGALESELANRTVDVRSEREGAVWSAYKKAPSSRT